MKNFLLFFLFLGSVLFCFQSCKCDRDEKEYGREISSRDMDTLANISVKINRYEVDLFSIPLDSLKQGLIAMQDKYSFFYSAEQLNDTMNIISMRRYLTDGTIKSLHAEVMKQYADVVPIEKNLSTMFQKTKYYLKDWTVPKVFTYVSGGDMEYPVKYAEGNMVIALDMFLGSKFPIYSMWGIPEYMCSRMNPENLNVTCAREIARSFVDSIAAEPHTLLDYMIYEGKLLYFVDLTIDNREDSVKIGYTAPQFYWADKNQGNVWSFFIEHKLLYSTEFREINKFIGEAPFTSTFSRTSAPRIAHFIGWQIVRSYMAKNKNVGVKELLLNANSQEILNKSGYKPEKDK